MTDLQSTDQYAARLLMVSFFLPQKWQVFAVMGASLYFIFRSLFTKQEAAKKEYGWAVLFSGLFLLYLAAVPFTPVEYRKFLLSLCERRVSLLFTPFIFVFIGPVFRKVIMGELVYFVYACFISCLAGNVDFIYHYYFYKGGLHELSHVAYRVMFEKFTGIHPTYMGMYLSCAVCIALCTDAFKYRNGNKLKFALVFMLLLFLLSLLVKAALIAMVLILLHFAWADRKMLYRYKMPLAGMGIALAAGCFFIPFIGQRALEVFSFFGHKQPAGITDNSMYVRKMIVDEDMALLRNNWLTGVGPGRLLHSLQERYFFYSLNHNFNVSHYDPHNEYLNEWLGFGIAGILLLVAILAIHLKRAFKAGNPLYAYCLIILLTTFFTETVLSRQEGVLFYALFTSLFFFSAKGQLTASPVQESSD